MAVCGSGPVAVTDSTAATVTIYSTVEFSSVGVVHQGKNDCPTGSTIALIWFTTTTTAVGVGGTVVEAVVLAVTLLL